MSSRMQRAAPFTLGFFTLLGACGVLGACARDNIAREGRVTQAQADQYMRDAIRQSSEGVVLEPSQKGLDQIERTRLNEIAQELRRPGAVCFLERAISTMEPGEIDGEQVWTAVPEGQAKFRVRVAVDGTVLSAEVLESGFEDKHMETCLSEALTKQRFVESRDSFAYFIDVYYWVSLGFFAEAQSESFAALMRRQQAEAGVRAKACLVGRVPAGEYVVTGLNLFDRDGRTVINRIDRGELPSEVSSCIATALKQIHIHAEPDAFIRPAAPKVVFEVAGDGTVRIGDERWLEMITLEEEAQREMRRQELLGQTGEGSDAPDAEVSDGWVDDVGLEDELAPQIPAPTPDIDTPTPTPSAKPPSKPLAEPDPDADPSNPGTKIDLSGNRRR